MMTRMLAATAATLIAGAAMAGDPDLAAAEEIYGNVCANCHGPNGRGMASFPSLAGNEADYIAGRLQQYRAGERVGSNSALMIPMAADLSDADIANLAAFISANFR